MKQAILILAHKNFNQVLLLAKELNSKFEIYIHFDKKMNLSQENEKQLKKEKINYISIYNVKWGSWNIVEATIALMNYALQDSKIEYMHLISGQDWPIKNQKEIFEYFEENKNAIFIDSQKATKVKKTGESIIWWQKYYFNYNKIDRKSIYGKIYHRLSILIQTIMRKNKFKKLNINLELYSGSQWVDLPRYVVEYILDYLQYNPNVKKMFSTGFCSDEFWIPTIVQNNINLRKKIVKNNHRFIKWVEQNNSFPAILDERNYEELIGSKAFFARKIDVIFSNELIKKLNNQNH